MNDFNTLNLLMSARATIVQQRAQIEQLAPKAHAYDTLAQVTRLTMPREGGFAQVDIAWELENAIEAIAGKVKMSQDYDPSAKPGTVRRKPGPKAKAAVPGEPTPAPRRRSRGK